ncbi:hypothetical protein [Microbispora amethystogenes]|nr:hypothetical protein [Microbispora amethystogenes]
MQWSRQEVVRAVTTCLLRADTTIDGYSVVGVIAEPDCMLVLFRWRRDPNTYALKIAFPTAPESPWTGLSVTSPDAWAADVAALLSEELGTGLVRPGRRLVRDGYVLLDTHEAPDVCPAGFSISPVPLDDAVPSLPRSQKTSGSPPAQVAAATAGCWLAEAGMDVTTPRQSIAEGKLVCWLQASVDNARWRPFVGQAAASWEDEQHTVARLDLVHIRPEVPSEVRDALIRLTVFEAAEAGALRVVTAIDEPELQGLGFRPACGGGFEIYTGSVGSPPDPTSA